MKTLKRVLSLCFVLLLIVTLLPVQARADDDEYIVRVYAGNKGTVEGGDMTETTVESGEKFDFSIGSVAVNDDKYYARGIRVAGLDNDMVYAGNASIKITEDTDFVVAYGILSSAVKYRVNYVNTDGNTLAASETYYGNVGDKPVVAFIYVEGYLPQAYNLTKTLSENEADNVFTFVYTPIPATTIITPVIPAGPGAAGGAGAGAAAGAGAGAAAGAAAGAGAGAAAPAQGANEPAQGGNEPAQGAGTEVTTPVEPAAPAEPEEIIDLDVPLAAPETENPNAPANGGAHIGTIAGIGAGLIALIAALWFFILRKKKKKDEKTEA